MISLCSSSCMEALFYCGVVVFFLIVDHLHRPNDHANAKITWYWVLVYRITFVVAFILSIMIPPVKMGLVWPWIDFAASATLAPYFADVVVQFEFKQYARYVKSPSWPLISVIYQIIKHMLCVNSFNPHMCCLGGNYFWNFTTWIIIWNNWNEINIDCARVWHPPFTVLAQHIKWHELHIISVINRMVSNLTSKEHY